MEKIDIVFTIDKNYIQHFTVACTSLLENNKKLIGKIFLVHDIKNNNKLLKSINFFMETYNIKINQLNLDSEIFDNFKISHQVSKATYFRLLLSEIIPSTIDKILFLDTDIVVKGDLTDLTILLSSFEHKYYLCAVNHNFTPKELKRLAFSNFQGEKYFNAGIMYVNLKKWREENISQKLIENAKRYNDNLQWWDQDVLNITFDKKWYEIDFKYNSFFLTERNDTKDYRIIHYTGSSKPWHYRNKHPYKNLYWKYLKMTPFYPFFPEDLYVKNIIKNYFITPVKNIIRSSVPGQVKKFIKKRVL